MKTKRKLRPALCVLAMYILLSLLALAYYLTNKP